MKIMRLMVLVYALLALPLGAEPMMTKLNVTGQGLVSLPAQKATVNLLISVVDNSANQAINKAAERQLNMIDALVAGGVAKDHLVTDTVRVDVVYDRDRKKDERQYAAQITVRVLNQSPKAIGQVLDLGFANGATEIGNITFMAEGLQEARLQAYELAVNNAFDKAERIAMAAGLEIKRILSISEGGHDHAPGPVFSVARAPMMEAGVISDVEFSGRDISQTAQVSVSYELGAPSK